MADDWNAGFGAATFAIALATVELLRKRGFFDQEGLAEIIDAALQYVEAMATSADEPTSRRAREILGTVQQTLGPPPPARPAL